MQNSRLAALSLAALLVAMPGLVAAAPSLDTLKEMADSIDRKIMDMPFYPPPTPSETRYVSVSDGTRIAVSLYFPEGFNPTSGKIAAVFQDSIYGRNDDAIVNPIALFNKAGFAVVIADVRGFNASFGAQNGFNTPQQTADEADLIGWIASQDWSDGNVAAFGHSVSATFADSMTGSGAPALKAAIIREFDFDEYGLNLYPGGIANKPVFDLADEMLSWYRGLPCLTDLDACAELGMESVGGNNSPALVQQILTDHQANIEPEAFRAVAYSDDMLGDFPVFQSGSIARMNAIREAKAPARISASWLDGMTAEGALMRYAMAPDNPMEITIGANSHPGGVNADPYEDSPFTRATPPVADQMAADVDFLQRVMAGEKIGRSIRYIVLGTDKWMNTSVWPPAGTKALRFNLAGSGLSIEEVAPETLTYSVDRNVTTGPFDRWATQTGAPVYYGDRRDDAAGRLGFDTAPTDEDFELVGNAELCLTLSVDKPQANVFAQIEDVAPDGRVTYLTETLLNLLHRKSAEGDCPETPGVTRSFARADALPVVPGEKMRFKLDFLPVSALIRAGHKLRLSLAGANADTFAPPAPGEEPVWTLELGGDRSWLKLPGRPWTGETE